MSETEPSTAAQRRHLFPRWPSDRVVWGLLIIGLAVAMVTGAEPAYGLIPGALAGGVQHVSGHASAWRRGGVERAFVMESSAISFYVVVVLLAMAAVLQVAGVMDIGIHWLAIGALYVDTIVRSVREHRYV
jgi:hypothetical protein